jgi:hypothetical protein
MRLVFRTTFALITIFLVSIGLIRARPYDDGLRTSLNLPPANCTMPCWSGIHPGMSTEAAVEILRHHPWVDQMRGISFMRWTWSGQQPTWIDASRPGAVSSHYGEVTQISIPTKLSMGDFWLMFDQVERGVIFDAGLSGMVYNFVNVRDGLFWIKTDLNCPIQAQEFWNASTLILIGGMSGFERFHADDFDDYTLPGWLADVSC